MPGPGFAAGPCLVKDTMQLAAFSHNNFMLGHAAMLINEGLPAHLVELAKRQMDLEQVNVPASWAWRSRPRATTRATRSATSCASCSRWSAKKVLCTDPYVKDASFVAAGPRARGVGRRSSSARRTSAYRELVDPGGQAGDRRLELRASGAGWSGKA